MASSSGNAQQIPNSHTAFKRIWDLLCVALILTLPLQALAFNYADIQWKTFKTKHFVFHYYDDVEWTARKAAVTAEEVYPKLTQIYGHEPSRRTHIVIRDDEDLSNGFAYFSLGAVTIWASPSSLSLRGRHDWIREVLTHEFSHIVSLQAASGAGWLIEGIRLGGISNGDSDANTDVAGSAFVPTNPYARWWAEGTAQLDTETVGHDTWDTSRDMLLRAATLENNLLSFDQMRNITTREHFGGELVYNQGFSFLLWLREKFGPDANARLAKTSSSWWALDFDSCLKKTFGVGARELYAEWKRSLEERYRAEIADIRKHPQEGRRIELVSPELLKRYDPRDRPYKDGVIVSSPRFSPDGKWFSWIDRGTLKVRSLETPFSTPAPASRKESRSLSIDIGARYYSWAPDSRKILISKREPNILDGYPYYDLFLADLGPIIDERKRGHVDLQPKKLTRRLRATQVTWSPDGKQIAFAQNRDGRRNLRLADPDGQNARDLVAIGGDAEAIEPAFSPDGKQIVFTLFNHNQSDIWVVDAAGGTPRPLMLDAADDREPTFTPDGKEILFSSDRSGIFQIYRLPADAQPGMAPLPVTSVETGAFMPHVSARGDALLYLRFSSYGYKPYEMPLIRGPFPPVAKPDTTDSSASQLSAEAAAPELQGKRYRPWLRPVRLFPSILWENDQFKAGVALQVSDYLEKHSFVGSALFGADQDYQISYTNRMFVPTFSAGYTGYIRNEALSYFTGVDEPAFVYRDNIQFINAGLSQDFRAREFFKGRHTLGLSYDRRFVDRRFGIPLALDNPDTAASDPTPTTDIRLITNDGMTLRWDFQKAPSEPSRDFSINPRGVTSFGATYSLVHTRCFSDATCGSAPQTYWYNEGTVYYAQYFAMPADQHTYWLRFNGGIKSRDVSFNDQFFLGGRLNYRAFGQISSNTLFYGYEDFSIRGETLLLFSTGYTLPIVRMIDRKTGWFYWDSVYASFFGEVGNAWNFGETKNLEQRPAGNHSADAGQVLLEDIGAEIRVRSFLFNDSNEWNSILRVAYGFQDNAKNGFSDSDLPVRFYLGIGTSF